ncbi:hypothetical protein GQ42DRAFT_653 [Ramicandelaber brevisporus]|nr:hypothetical protein GQ42DRAFT_653 [Ramicandelaber brevisporus]
MSDTSTIVGGEFQPQSQAPEVLDLGELIWRHRLLQRKYSALKRRCDRLSTYTVSASVVLVVSAIGSIITSYMIPRSSYGRAICQVGSIALSLIGVWATDLIGFNEI